MRKVTMSAAREVAARLGRSYPPSILEQFRRGLEVEQEHSAVSRAIRRGFGPDAVRLLFGSELGLYGMIAVDHLREMPDYYSRLDEMEQA
jgi:hypothetical protein